MNRIPFLHYKKDKNNLIVNYYIAIIPILLFGIYKNGFLLYINDLINFKYIFLPIYFYLISIVVGLILSLITKEDKKYNILLCLLIASSISINTNMIIYPILLFVSLFIGKYVCNKFKFNVISFSRLVLILSLLINSYSYLNIGEKLNKFNYNIFDIFLGYGVGGIATTSFLILIISLIILSFNKYYKKIIPIVSSLTFILFGFIYIILTKNYDYIRLLLNGTIYFGFIFIAPDIYITPNSKRGMIIFAVLIGILASLFSILFNIYEASYISILLVSIFVPFINKIINKKYLEC